MALPSWAPASARVASYVPKRTRPADNATDTLLGDFTAATSPTGAQVAVLIADAVAWVLGVTGTLTSAHEEQGTLAATLRAAGMVELAYPGEDADRNRGLDLLAQADAALRQLLGAVNSNPPTGILPRYSFPDPHPYGDTDFQ